MIKIVNGRLVTPEGVIENASVTVEKGLVKTCGPARQQDASAVGGEIFDAGGQYLLPGFIDIHCHGGGGYYVHEAPDKVAEAHLRHGTTSLVATCLIMEPVDLLNALKKIKAARHPAIAGIHLEGPYLSPRYGAKKELSRLPDPDEYHALLEAGGERLLIWTFAPELEGTDAFVDAVGKKGIVLSVGHSEADARRIFDLVPRGLKLGCHIMCATGATPAKMGGVREVGVDEAVMMHDDMYAEVIPDSLGIHVRPLMLKLIMKARGADRTIIITDAVKSTGLDDCDYQTVRAEDAQSLSWSWRRLSSLPPLHYMNAEGKEFLEIADDINVSELGRLSGSKLTMDRAVRNMIQHTGASLVEASLMASLNPARLLRIDDSVGSLEAGKRANLVVASNKIEISRVMLDGQWVE